MTFFVETLAHCLGTLVSLALRIRGRSFIPTRECLLFSTVCPTIVDTVKTKVNNFNTSPDLNTVFSCLGVSTSKATLSDYFPFKMVCPSEYRSICHACGKEANKSTCRANTWSPIPRGYAKQLQNLTMIKHNTGIIKKWSSVGIWWKIAEIFLIKI